MRHVLSDHEDHAGEPDLAYFTSHRQGAHGYDCPEDEEDAEFRRVRNLAYRQAMLSGGILTTHELQTLY